MYVHNTLQAILATGFPIRRLYLAKHCSLKQKLLTIFSREKENSHAFIVICGALLLWLLVCPRLSAIVRTKTFHFIVFCFLSGIAVDFKKMACTVPRPQLANL